MSHRIMKVALINSEIDNTINALRYVLKFAKFMSSEKKSEYGRLLVKLEKQAQRLPKKIEVRHVESN